MANAAIAEFDVACPVLVLADLGRPDEDGLHARPPESGSVRRGAAANVRAIALSAYARVDQSSVNVKYVSFPSR